MSEKGEQRSKLRRGLWATLLVLLGGVIGLQVPAPVATGIGNAIEQVYQDSK